MNNLEKDFYFICACILYSIILYCEFIEFSSACFFFTKLQLCFKVIHRST